MPNLNFRRQHVTDDYNSNNNRWKENENSGVATAIYYDLLTDLAMILLRMLFLTQLGLKRMSLTLQSLFL